MGNANDIQKFDPQTLMQGVKDRIKATYVSMIPDEQWESMVKKELDDFFRPKEISYQRESKSDFQLLCRDAIHAKAKEEMVKFLATPEFLTTWESNGIPVCNEFIRKMVVENSGVILANFYGGLFQSMLMNFSNSLRNSGHF